jgi:carboxypeptidase T
MRTLTRPFNPSVLFSLLLILAMQSPVWAQHSEDGQHLRVRIHLENGTMREVAAAGIDVTHGLFQPDKHFIADLSADEVTRLHATGLSLDTLIVDLNTYYRQLGSGAPGVTGRSADPCDPSMGPPPVPQHFSTGSMGGFFTYQEMLDILDSMRVLYPDLISMRKVIDDTLLTHEGRPVYWVRISDNPDEDEVEPEVAYTALHHAREPGSLSQMIFFMWHLLEGYDTDPRIKYLLEETELYFVPCLNPDGYIFNESIAPQGGGMWRKNRRADAIAPEGVDLNRNYGYEWGFDNFGSSPDPEDQDYRGPEPFSEPETQMMRNFCQKRHFRYMLNYHSYGQLLIFPFGYNDQSAEPGFDVLSEVLSSDNEFLAGTAIETVGYPVNGVSDDWMYGDTITKDRIVAITPEISTFFWTDPSDIVPDCQTVLSLNLELASLPHSFYQAEAQVPGVITSTQGYFPFTVSRIGLEAGEAIVSLSGRPDHFQSFGQPKAISLGQYEQIADSLFFQVADGIPSGTELEFYLTTQDGTGSRTDTVRTLLVLPFSRTLLFFEDGNTFDEWEVVSGSWDTTGSDFLSPPTACTDSPDGLYLNNSNAVLRSPVLQLPSGKIMLRFWARWDIESGYDHLALSVQPEGDSARYPLCGLYTNAGTQYQLESQPVYDGTQEEWVHELVDLSDFSGQNIRLVWSMVSDPFVRGDGFTFDDLEVYAINETVTQTLAPQSHENLSIRISPNPARSSAFVEWEQSAAGIVQAVELLTTAGLLVRRYKNEGGTAMTLSNLGNLPAGQYVVRLVGKNGEVLGVEVMFIQ